MVDFGGTRARQRTHHRTGERIGVPNAETHRERTGAFRRQGKRLCCRFAVRTDQTTNPQGNPAVVASHHHAAVHQSGALDRRQDWWAGATAWLAPIIGSADPVLKRPGGAAVGCMPHPPRTLGEQSTCGSYAPTMASTSSR